MAKKGDSNCERCDSSQFVNTYQKGLPHQVKLCPGCWKNLTWARTEHPGLWSENEREFLESYLQKGVSPYPDDPDFKRRLAIRALVRLRHKRLGQIGAMEKSCEARADDIQLAAEFLEESPEELKDKFIKQAEDERIGPMGARIQKLLDMDPVYNRYLKNIRMGHGSGPGTIACGWLLGEIGAARTILCLQHKRPKPLTVCEHGRKDGSLEIDPEEFAEAILISTPNQRAYGINAFPSGGDLRSFFGLGFIETGATLPSGDPWYLRAKLSSAHQKTKYSRIRKTAVVEYLAGSFEKIPKAISPRPPFAEFLDKEKISKAEEWGKRFKDTPPEICSACFLMGCKACFETKGRWEKPKDGNALWVCQCHDGGYWFGSPAHLRNHARGKLASLFLDLLRHAWRYLELDDEKPYHSLAAQYLDSDTPPIVKPPRKKKEEPPEKKDELKGGYLTEMIDVMEGE